VRSAGFFRNKAIRLKQIAEYFAQKTSIEELKGMPSNELRQSLLALDGVGPETADSILLYAFHRPVLVIDAYLRRLAQRLLARSAPIPDKDLRHWVALEFEDPASLNELHALVVAHGKSICGSEPLCDECKLRAICLTGAGRSNS
jgi:endonuclease-3 related protein